MYSDVIIIFDNIRKTWNVFADGEWYLSTDDYDQAMDCYNTLLTPEEDL